MSFISFIFMPAFPHWEGRRGNGPWNTSRSTAQFQIVLLAPHQDRTKEGRRCSHSTWSLDDIWVVFPWV